MKTVEVSQSALESLQKMVEQLQGERDEAVRILQELESEFRRVYPIYYYAEPWAHNKNITLIQAQMFIAKCTAKLEVLE